MAQGKASVLFGCLDSACGRVADSWLMIRSQSSYHFVKDSASVKYDPPRGDLSLGA